MSDYDNDILLQAQRDGIRTVSGHHIRTPGVCPDCGGLGGFNVPTTDGVDPWAPCHCSTPRPVWEREGRQVQCNPCGDQGCDFCNDRPEEETP